MQNHQLIGSRLTLAMAGTVAVVLGVAALTAKADVWDKKTILSVNQPIQVQDTFLEPGTYVFKLHNSNSNRHIVQIYNRDENRLINTVMAIPNYRLQPTGKSQFSFYETPPGTARAMHAWFYPGDNFGQEFTYPKQLRHLAVATSAQQAAVEPPQAPVAHSVEPVDSSPEPPQALVEPKREEPELMAQNNPQPQAPRVVEPAAPAVQPKAVEPAELPKTATPFPLIGLSGLGCLLILGLLRINHLG